MGVDIEKLTQLAEEKGWHVSRTGGQHVQFKSPEGKVVIGSNTPSDRRAGLNLRADLRRAGLEVPPQNDPKQISRASKGETQGTLRAIFMEQPEHVFTMDELWTRLHARLPVVRQRGSMEQCLWTMNQRGEIKRLDRGQYRWLHKDDEPAPQVKEATFQTGGTPAGVKTGEAEMDEDLAALDAALAEIGRFAQRVRERVAAAIMTILEEEEQRVLEPLARLDTVVRRNREALVHLAHLRASLRL
jgi:predicted RNA binding protein YcfA (HicA-like mRNA interferase family)